MGAEFFEQGVGGGEVGDGVCGEEGREAVLPVLMAALDLALGLRRGGVTEAHAVKVEGFAELGERAGDVGEEEGMVVDVEGEREAVGEDGGRQEVEASEEILLAASVVPLRPALATRRFSRTASGAPRPIRA